MKPSKLFITDGREISANEGTTQVDPIAMEMYALGLMSLLTLIISNNTGNLIHEAFSGDLISVDKTRKLTEWWKNVLHYGLYRGYYVNKLKSWVITKEEYIQIANEIFRDYNIKITTD